MTRPLRILLIEDDREIVRGLLLRLKAIGHDGFAVHDGGSGLAAAAGQIPDAIVLDLRLPDMDGFAVLTRLQQHDVTKVIPVIVVSANVAERAKQDALELGAYCFIEKPYEFARLATALNRIALAAVARADSATGGLRS